MPRVKEFDPDRALDAAMRVFWEKGYQGTSAQDLCDGTGLGRSSIYATFSSKRDLYERSLRRYDELMAERQQALLRDDGVPVRERLRALLAAVVDDELGDGPRGCFAVNAAVEFGGRDPEVTALVERTFRRMREALRTAVSAAQAAGEVAGDADPAVLADYVHTSMNGLRVMARTVRVRRRLMAVVDTVVASV